MNRLANLRRRRTLDTGEVLASEVLSTNGPFVERFIRQDVVQYVGTNRTLVARGDAPGMRLMRRTTNGIYCTGMIFLMKPNSMLRALVPAMVSLFLTSLAWGGTWNDHFTQPTLADEWTGNRNAFRIQGGILEGQSASPVTPSPLNVVELAQDSTDLDVACWINVVEPNLRVCTKGALILRHSGNEGYVFALHEPTQTIEVYRLSNHEMLLNRSARIELKKWYYVRAKLRGPTMDFYVDGQSIGTITDDRSASGSVGVAVQDAEAAWFDDFSVSGPEVTGNVDDISLPELRVTKNSSNQVVLRFLASPPYDYFVQSSSKPFSHDWETIETFRAKLDSFEAEISDPITNGMHFYRIEKVHCGCR